MRAKVGIHLAAVALALVFASSASAAFNARGSVEQVYATDLPAGGEISLLNAVGTTVETRNANDLGGALFRDVTPGSGYRVRLAETGEISAPVTVMTKQSAPPSTDIYNQTIPSDGYGYMTMRDGTKLAYSSHPPTDVTNVLGFDLPYVPVGDLVPLPTLVEYSGYGYARPEGPQSGIAALANIMGFRVVDVNMRGTGCSGGAFNFFEPLQNLDGYDVIETVARQPWVAHGKVGMLGISYGGISQLFTAQTQPPSLAAITPLSVIDQVQTTLYPGGILNTGFAFNWAQERAHEAQAAGPDSGQSWAYQRVQEGDLTCAANQAMHPEAEDLIGKVRANDHYNPEIVDPLTPTTFVDKINVPVFMACQFTDEQTGGHCPTLARHMTGTDKKWFTYTNGTHVDSLSPEVFNRLYDFLEIYVAKEPPILKAPILQLGSGLIFQAIFGIDGMTLPPDPIQQQLTYDGAKAAFEAQPSVRVLFDNGAGSSNPGYPYPGFERSYSAFPVPGTTARSWYLASEGALADEAPQQTAADAFTWDADARPPTDFSGNTGSGTGGLWGALPPYHWSQDPEGSAVAYLTDPLADDATVVGGGAVEVWVRSSAPNVDLQATVSEVRADGKETFVQSGWVRGNERKLNDDASTLLEPVLSLRAADVSPMPADRFVKVTVPLYYQGHVYRSGSRIRVRISAPGGDQPIWAFSEAEPAGTAQVAIGYGPDRPSRLILPVVPGARAPTGLPPCPGLRGEPCRDYQSFENAPLPADPTGGAAGALQPASSLSRKACAARKKRGKKKQKIRKRRCGKKKRKHAKKK